MALSTKFQGCNANRAARPVDKFDLLWEHIGQAVLHESMSLAAANLHDRPRSGDRFPDLRQDFFNQLLAAIFF